jgi:hypothetical protein
MKATRLMLGVVVPVAWVVIAVAAFALAWTRLPDPLATHWGISGAPNGAMPRITALALFGGASLLAAIAARVGVSRDHGIAQLVGGATFTGILFATLGVVTVLANLDAARWQDAHAVGIPLALGCCALAGLGAALASRVARVLEPARAGGAVARPTIGLGPTERAMWSASAKNGMLFVLALLVAITGVLTWASGRSWVGVVTCSAVAIIATALAEVHARIDDRGLSIGFGPLKFPRMRVALDRIVHAETTTVQPMAHGGWGYRGSLTLLGRAAVVIRRGEGLKLALRGNKTLTITIDDAATAAGLINDLVARR